MSKPSTAEAIIYLADAIRETFNQEFKSELDTPRTRGEHKVVEAQHKEAEENDTPTTSVEEPSDLAQFKSDSNEDAPDKEDVREALVELQNATDPVTAKGVLIEFGAKTTGQLDEANYVAVIKRAKELNI